VELHDLGRIAHGYAGVVIRLGAPFGRNTTESEEDEGISAGRRDTTLGGAAAGLKWAIAA